MVAEKYIDNIELYFESFPEAKRIIRWCEDLFEIWGSNCSKELLDEVKSLFFDESMLFNVTTKVWNDDRESFIKYLKSNPKIKNREYVDEGLRYIIKNARAYGHGVPAYTSYVAITNFDDIKVNRDISNLKPYDLTPIGCYLDDYKLSGMYLKLTPKGILFDGVSTKIQLVDNNIGTLMFKVVCGELVKLFPGIPLYADSVWNQNHGAIRFYERLGAKLINIDEHGLRTYVFAPEAMEALSNITIDNPELYPTKKLFVSDPTLEIRDYLKRIVNAQIELIDKGTTHLPKQILAPQSIVLSKSVVEQMLTDELIDYFGACENPNEFQFAWKDQEEKAKTIVGIKITEFNDYEITSIYRREKGYLECIYDIKHLDRKRGVLAVLDQEDINSSLKM